MGLGLAISRSIAEAHDGSLSLESAGAGLGSVFRLELGTVSTGEAAALREPALPPPPQPAGAGLKVLLVEDNQETLHYLTMILENRNYNVVPVDRLSAALAAAERAHFDLLISDIELPDGTGLELIHDLGGGRKIPGIAISGFGSEEDLQQSAEAGFAEHLTKPIDLNRLESAIRRVMARADGQPGQRNGGL
jgi:two-component system CheB/CheR fusion protein